MDPINKLIQENKLDDAKTKIKELENQLCEQSSLYTLSTIRNRIEKLKEEYVKKISKIPKKIPNIKKLNFTNNIPKFVSNEQKICIDNLNNDKIDNFNCLECKIENCENIIGKSIICENGLTLINVKNSEIHCSVGQIRLVNSENVNLKIFTKTGIYLQNSTGIIISSLKNDLNNKYDIVCDFTYPFSNKNYKII